MSLFILEICHKSCIISTILCVIGNFNVTDQLCLNWLLVVQSLSRVWLCNPWTAACQASLYYVISQSLLTDMVFKNSPKDCSESSIELTVEQWAAFHSPSFVQEMRKHPLFAYVSQKINQSNFSNKRQISYLPLLTIYWASLVIQMAKNLLAMQETTCNTAGLDSIPYLGRSPEGGHCYPLQYSCLENSMDRGAWRAVVHGVTKSRTWLSN